MTWRNVTVEEERYQFIQESLNTNTQMTFRELCEKFNISPKTGYKWLNRFLEEGKSGLIDHSRSRLTHSEKIPDEVERYIIALRKEYPTWGPKKIHALMVYRKTSVPSVSSIGNLLKKHALSKPRYFRRHVARTSPLSHCKDSNDVWQYDFKGHFKTGDGKTCEPLTITDGHSRYLLKCVHMNRKRCIDVWPILEEAFFEYGLPLRIRSDNGPPFATTGVGRLSRLAINIIKTGVIPEWIEPGCPQENGRHERFHLTLKNETASPPALSLPLQIKKFEQFKEYYNTKRPHEALGQVVPKSVYKRSKRQWDGVLRSPEYDTQYEVRRVSKGGNIGWRGQTIFLSESLYRENVGIREIKFGIMEVTYGPIALGTIDLNKGFKRF